MSKSKLISFLKIIGILFIITIIFISGKDFGKKIVEKREWEKYREKRGWLIDVIKDAGISNQEIEEMLNAEKTGDKKTDSMIKALQTVLRYERGRQALFCTNYYKLDGTPSEEEINLPVPTKVFDLGYILYTKEFADKYGYPYEYVHDLPEGVQVMEFKMYTYSSFIASRVNILLDKDLDIELPEISFASTGAKLKFFDKRKDYVEPEELKEIRRRLQEEPGGWSWEITQSQNVYLATMNFVPKNLRKKGERMAQISAGISEYSNRYFKDYNYFSVSIGATALTLNILEQGNASIWIKKKGRHYHSDDDPENFIRIQIPERLTKKMIKWIKQGELFKAKIRLQAYRRSLKNGRL